jgi:polygalacturonase
MKECERPSAAPSGCLLLKLILGFIALGSSSSSSSTPPSSADADAGSVCDAVADCGALADNATLADAALSACARRCATVVFPAGAAFRVASVDVSNTSGLSLVFREGASLWASADKADYPLAPFYPRMGKTLCYRAVIFGRNVTRFVLEGPASAVIDGAGAAWQPGRNVSAIQAPKLLELVDVSDANVTGMTFQNSANWHVHVLWCARVRFVNNTVLGDRSFGGTDGIDPSSCTDVLIDGAYIDVGDDAVAVTAGGAHDVTNELMPTARVVVRNSYLRARNFAIGSATYSNVSEVLVEDCRIGDDEGSAAWGIKIKSHSPNGGDVSNVTFRNLRLGKIAPNSYEEPNGGMALSLYSNYGEESEGEDADAARRARGAPPFAPSRTHNISFVNITGLSARWAANPLSGVPGGSELGPLHFVDVDFGAVSEAQPWLCDNISGTTAGGVVRPPLPKSCGVVGGAQR